jgi:ribosomal protein L3 glutamine methyltransferase
MLKLSDNDKRNKTYNAFLDLCRTNKATVNDIIHLGYKLMHKENVYHHFFGNHSLMHTAEYLTYFSLKKPLKKWNDKISEDEAIEIIKLFERRIADRLPVAYLTNETTFCGYKFYVNEHVLIPRSIMVTRFHDFLKQTHWQNNRVLDLCTGSGCIGITLALLKSEIDVDLADISIDALVVAQINIDKHMLNDRVRCIQSDLFSSIQNKYDLIISNPPYVSTTEYNASAQEFKMEPKLALEAEEDGLDIINRILSQAKQFLNPEGILIVEVGFSAAKLLKKKYPHIPFQWLKYRKPSGKEPFWGVHCIFLCNQKDLINS